MWLESPKVSLGDYVGAIAQHDVVGGCIRTMADLKSLGEPEGEVHLDQLVSVAGEDSCVYTKSTRLPLR